MIKPYSKITTIDMWTDPYISKQMLKYHINPEHDIASRRQDIIIKTCRFISQYIGKPSKICDFGCGPGLYTNELQQLKHDVIGVDVSKRSLAYAQEHNSNVKYINMNYVTDTLNEQIDVAMLIYCDFGALTPTSRNQFLRNLHKTLKDDGLFFFDVFNDKRFEELEENTVNYEETDGFFMPGKAKITSQYTKYPDMFLSLSYYKAVGQKTIELYNWDKHYSHQEINTLMNDYGFIVIDYFSNTIGKKNYQNSDLFMFVCKKI